MVSSTVKPLFTYSIGQKWLYVLQKVLNMRYGFPYTYMWSGLIGQWPSQKIAKICQVLRLTHKVSNFQHLHVKFTCFIFLTEIFGFFSSKHQITTRKSYHLSILKNLEVMDNFNPAELIPWSPHVTRCGLCTSIYVLQYLKYVLWIVCILKLSTLSEVRISNFSTYLE